MAEIKAFKHSGGSEGPLKDLLLDTQAQGGEGGQIVVIITLEQCRGLDGGMKILGRGKVF